MTGTIRRIALALAGFGLAATLAACEAPPQTSKQTGYRGTGMAQISSPELEAYLKQANVVPPPPYPLEPSDAPLAKDFYQNVQVLGDINADEFNRLMLSITEWVAPNEGCNYCHNPENLASDEVYTKVVARKMLQMTRTINSSWTDHVKQTGVTCYTCHRGKHVPANVWAQPTPEDLRGNFIGAKRGHNDPVASVAFSSLPKDPFTPYLLGSEPIRVQGGTALPNDAAHRSIASTEKTYGLMMHMSKSLGVNCTYCHNSRDWASWSDSTPQRVTAWYGIRMARTINTDYIEPLKPVFPASRLGPLGDPLKVNCTTCHQGANKPLLGVSMLADHPALKGSRLPPSPVDPNAAPADGAAPAGDAPAAVQPAGAPAAPATPSKRSPS